MCQSWKKIKVSLAPCLPIHGSGPEAMKKLEGEKSAENNGFSKEGLAYTHF